MSKENYEHSKLTFWLIFFGIVLCMLIGMKAQSQTKAQVYRELLKQGVKYPKIVLAQTILETKWYQCEECSLRYNNIFGFRHKSRNTEENPRGYYIFYTWQDAVIRYKTWQDDFYVSGNYYTFLLEIGYAGNMDKYISDLKWIKDKVF